jgi:putative phosphoesterase
MKIGIISDTHIPLNAKELPPQLTKIFACVELILHAGDIYLPSVLDELGALAPVFAAIGDGDERQGIRIQTDPRMKKSHVVSVENVRIGLTHSLRLPEASIEKAFGCRVDIAVCGHTHWPNIETQQGVLVVNPGSATLPNHQVNKLGTVGLLDLTQGKAQARIVLLDQLE